MFGLREQHRHRETLRAIAAQVEDALPGLRTGAAWAIAARRGAAS